MLQSCKAQLQIQNAFAVYQKKLNQLTQLLEALEAIFSRGCAPTNCKCTAIAMASVKESCLAKTCFYRDKYCQVEANFPESFSKDTLKLKPFSKSLRQQAIPILTANNGTEASEGKGLSEKK